MPRILVVDDSAEARYLMRTVLVHAGHTVVEAGNGVEALEIARADAPDAVVSDGLMPVMDGFRLCLEMKRDPQLANIPFIFHTASFTHPDDLQLASAMGAEAYLIKPAEPSAIIEAVDKVLAAGGGDAIAEQRLATILERYGERLENKLDQKVAALEATKALRDSYQALLKHLPLPVVTLDLTGRLDFSSEVAAEFLGDDSPDAMLTSVHPEDAKTMAEFIASLVADPRPVQISVRVRHRNGQYHVLELSARPYESAEGLPLGFVMAGVDVTRQEQQRELLLHASEHDPLTDLPTRHVFDRRFDEVLRNIGKGASCALLLINSDDLKAVNDRFGFDVGDATIANLAHTISETVRPGDLVARLCATEFVVLAEGLSWEDAGDLANKIQAAVAAASLVPSAPDRRIHVNASVSVVPEVRPLGVTTPAAESAQAGADRADLALLEALQGSPALSFVPVYSLADGMLSRCSVRYGYEVEKRLVAGDELALGAAKYGVARRVSARIVESALAQAGIVGVTCSVELSLASILDPTVFERAELAADRLGVDPHRLLFEIAACDPGGVRPPAHWLQAARRTPVKLVHVCNDLSALTTSTEWLAAAAEIELPLSAVLDREGHARPTAEAVISRWREAGAELTVSGLQDLSMLVTLNELGVSRASGDALAPLTSDLSTVPRRIKVKG